MAANKTLPPTPILSSSPPRSAVAMALLWGTIMAKALFGIDLVALLVERGLGPDQEGVTETLTFLWLGALAAWAWLERRAPHARLTWRKRSDPAPSEETMDDERLADVARRDDHPPSGSM